MPNEKIVTARFFKTDSGNEPVRDWLKEQKSENTAGRFGTVKKTLESGIEWRY